MILALVALLLGLCGSVGRGPLRWKTPSLSVFLFLLWVMEALGE
jgi:hypothetical protein